MSDLAAFVMACGYEAGVDLGDGRAAFLATTVVGGSQILIGHATAEGGVAERFSYPSITAGHVAWVRWLAVDMTGEPEGWVRHQPSDRRRSYNEDGTVTEWKQS